MIAAPLLMRLYLDGSYNDPALAAQRDSAITFARYCLPQVFFYGMFVLLGQVLNARGRFGPMMWAPIANNVDRDRWCWCSTCSGSGRSTPAPAVRRSPRRRSWCSAAGRPSASSRRSLILLPDLRAAGFHFRPRFDFRGTGLGHTLRLGIWTVLFVIVNQVAYTVVVRLASGGTARTVCERVGRHHQEAASDATGYTVYAAAFLFVMVPHAIITVSLATAILPRLSAKAADGDLPGLAGTLAVTLRTALAVVIPFAFALPLLAYDASKVLFGYGATASTFDHYVPSMILFGPGIVFFTVHYLMLRGFYALELNRTVFFIQCAIGATNVVVAILLVNEATAAQTVTGAGDRVRRVVPAGLHGLLRDAPRTARWARDASPGAVPGPDPDRRRGLDRGGLGRRAGAARPAPTTSPMPWRPSGWWSWAGSTSACSSSWPG